MQPFRENLGEGLPSHHLGIFPDLRDANFNQSNAFGAPYPKPGLCIVCQFEMSTRISYYAETAPRDVTMKSTSNDNDAARSGTFDDDDDDDVKKKG